MGWKCLPHREARGLSEVCSCRAYHDGEAVVSLDTVLVTLLFGVLAAPQLSFGD